MKKLSIHPAFILLTASMFLGLSGVFAKLISLPAQSIILGRSLVAICIFFPLIALTQTSLRVIGQVNRLKVLAVSCLMAGHWVCFYQSIKLSTVSIAVILIYTYPIMTATIEPFWTKKKHRMMDFYFSILVIISLMLISGDAIEGVMIKEGMIFGLISALCLALRNILIKDINSTHKPIALMFYQNLATVLILFPFSMTQLTQASIVDLALIATVGIGSSVIGHTLFVKSLEYFSATTVGLVSSFQVVYATCVAWIVLKEPITVRVMLGGCIVLYVVIHQLLSQKKHNQVND